MIYVEVCSEVWQTERAIKTLKKRLHTKNRTYGGDERTSKQKATRHRGRGSPRRPIVSDAFTVVMMHRATGPLLSLKLYEASLAHILLQWHHCLAHSSLAACWWWWWRWRGFLRNKPIETYIRKRNVGERKNERQFHKTRGNEGDMEERNRETSGLMKNETYIGLFVMCSGPVRVSAYGCRCLVV